MPIVDHSIADWDTLGLNFASVLKDVPASAYPGQSQEELTAMLREQITQALAESTGQGCKLLKSSLLSHKLIAIAFAEPIFCMHCFHVRVHYF